MKLSLIIAGVLGSFALTACTTIMAIPDGSPTIWEDGSGFYQGTTPQAKVGLSFKRFVDQGDQGLGDQGIEKVVVYVTNTSTVPILVSDANFFAEVVPGSIGKLTTKPLLTNDSSMRDDSSPPTKLMALDAEQLIEQAHQAVENSDTSYALTSTINLAATIVSAPGAASGNKLDQHTLDEVKENQNNSAIQHSVERRRLSERLRYLKANLLRKTTLEPGKSLYGLVEVPCLHLWKKFVIGADFGGQVTFPMSWKTLR